MVLNDDLRSGFSKACEALARLECIAQTGRPTTPLAAPITAYYAGQRERVVSRFRRR